MFTKREFLEEAVASPNNMFAALRKHVKPYQKWQKIRNKDEKK
jgi:hypothetical protein